jgi:hypothetical protein
MARPKANIDLVELEKLCGLQCTDEEIAAFLGISSRTLQRRRQNTKFAEAMDRAKAKGRISVRRHLFRLAANGNVAAAIFLAKNVLHYRDVVSNEHSGPNGTAIQIEGKPDFNQLNEDDLRQLRAITLKTRPDKGNRQGTGNAKPA